MADLSCTGGWRSSFWWGHEFVNEHAAFLPLKLHLFFLGAACYFIERWLRSNHRLGTKYGPALVILGILVVWLLRWQHWAVTIWLLCFGAAVGLWDNTLPRLQNFIRSLLMSGAVQWLGRRSYSLYLLHWPTVIAGLGLLLFVHPAATHWEAVISMLGLGLPVILLGTDFLHRYVEAPTLKIGRRLSRADTAPPRL